MDVDVSAVERITVQFLCECLSDQANLVAKAFVVGINEPALESIDAADHPVFRRGTDESDDARNAIEGYRIIVQNQRCGAAHAKQLRLNRFQITKSQLV